VKPTRENEPMKTGRLIRNMIHSIVYLNVYCLIISTHSIVTNGSRDATPHCSVLGAAQVAFGLHSCLIAVCPIKNTIPSSFETFIRYH
jgi:hypothetical protein